MSSGDKDLLCTSQNGQMMSGLLSSLEKEKEYVKFHHLIQELELYQSFSHTAQMFVTHYEPRLSCFWRC